MKWSRATAALAAALLGAPGLPPGAFAQQPTRPAPTIGRTAAPAGGAPGQGREPAPEARRGDVPNRTLRRSGGISRTRRPRDPDALPWQPGPVPETIPIRLAGVARDEAGRAVPGASVTLYSITDRGSKPVGKATTDAEGGYVLLGARLPVTTSFNGHQFPREITPYAQFILCGLAPGLGIAWSPQESMYALDDPSPDDIQGRLPLDSPVILDLTFPKAAALAGKVVDERGEPVAGAKLQVIDVDMLDDAGHETNNRQGYDWKSLPDDIGRAVTDRTGRFRMERLPDRACFYLDVTRPETENTAIGFFAATVDGPDMVHEPLPPGAFNGRLRHEVKTRELTITFPKIRPIAVAVVGDDTGQPIAGARVRTLGDGSQSELASFGRTDAGGKILLGLPPGTYRGIAADPPIETRYIRTYQRPLVVEPGEGSQPYEIRLKAGCEVLIEAVEAGTGKPVANAFFWQAAEDRPAETGHVNPSTFGEAVPWTDETGKMRAVLAPEPGKRYRFRFAGIHEPNMPSGINPAVANRHGYEAEPAQSEPVELAGGRTVRLRFVLRKPG